MKFNERQALKMVLTKLSTISTRVMLVLLVNFHTLLVNHRIVENIFFR